MYVFLHLPKTGGTAIHDSLNGILGDRLFSFKKWNDLYKYDRYFKIEDLDSIPKQTEFLIGHYIVNDFTKEYYDNFMTMFREPSQRIISSYFHEIRHGHSDGTMIDFVKNADKSHMGKRKISVNMYQSAIGDIKILNRFVFIGITEYFEESLMLFAKKFNINLKPEFIKNNNINPNKKIKDKYDIPKDVFCEIKKLNQADYEIYNYAKELFFKDCEDNNITIRR